MSDLERYLAAATRENTRLSYASAIKHFEEDWGGHLPSHAEGIARYLAAYADRLAIATLRQRLAALARWHNDHGFADPTRAVIVRQALRGIQAVHPAREKKAAPLQLTELGAVSDWLEGAAARAKAARDVAAFSRHLRDRALILLGFWRGFRADELVRLRIELIEILPGEGLNVFLPTSKTDRDNRGRVYKTPALSRWCPVAATQAWLDAAGRQEGALFPGIDRWGTLSQDAMNVGSVAPVFRRAFAHAGIERADHYSGHSLRRGFASWANANGWDVKSLMEYVGWRNVNTALRYIDVGQHFAKASIELSVSTQPPAALPPPTVTASAPLLLAIQVRFSLTSYSNNARKRTNARRLIEEACLARHRAQRQDANGYHFLLHIADNAELDDAMAMVLDDMYRIADNHECFLDVTITDKDGTRRWD